jgi:hypothetical protein
MLIMVCKNPFLAEFEKKELFFFEAIWSTPNVTGVERSSHRCVLCVTLCALCDLKKLDTKGTTNHNGHKEYSF